MFRFSRFFSSSTKRFNMEGNTVATKIIKVEDINNISKDSLTEAVPLLQRNEVVAFPTETVYGLGANALSSEAVKKIFQIKGRPSDNPLIVHISSMEMMKDLVKDSDTLLQTHPFLKKLCDTFWPGPLTFLLPKSEKVPMEVTGGHQRVGIRFPSHPVARALISQSGLPLAAPSANTSGRPSPTTAQHVWEDLQGKIHCIVDGGPTEVGVESTVVDIFSSPPLILRPGGVTLEKLREIVPHLELYSSQAPNKELEANPPTPGLKYRHYSPDAPIVLFQVEGSSQHLRVTQRVEKELAEGRRVGLLRTHSSHSYSFGDSVIIREMGDENHLEITQRNLFGALRELDNLKVDVILVEGVVESQEGVAIMNRLCKAAKEIC